MSLYREQIQQGEWLFKHRSYLPLLLLALGLVVTWFNPVEFPLPYPDLWALLPGLAGLWIRCSVVGRTPKNTSGRNTSEGQVADVINTSGWYSIVRHPLYLGNFLMWISPVMLTGNMGLLVIFVLIFMLYYERIMMAEEAFLQKKFGKTFEDWAARTPAFIPQLRGYKNANLPFSWKKVLRKEKNGLFALALVNFFMEQWLLFVKTGKFPENPFTFWSWFSIIGAVVYLILKFLKYNSRLLDDDRG